MAKSWEIEPSLGVEMPEFYPETVAVIEQLRSDPTTAANMRCIHEGEPAVGVYEVPGGCVAFRGVETQPLCPQHVLSDGSLEGMTLVVDLSVGGEWAKYTGTIPDYWLDYAADGSSLALMSARELPFRQ